MLLLLLLFLSHLLSLSVFLTSAVIKPIRTHEHSVNSFLFILSCSHSPLTISFVVFLSVHLFLFYILLVTLTCNEIYVWHTSLLRLYYDRFHVIVIFVIFFLLFLILLFFYFSLTNCNCFKYFFLLLLFSKWHCVVICFNSFILCSTTTTTTVTKTKIK